MSLTKKIIGPSGNSNPGVRSHAKKQVFFGEIFGRLEKLIFGNQAELASVPPEYRLLKYYDQYADQNFSSHIGLYEDEKGSKVVIKSLFHHFENLKYQQIINESVILKMLEISSPKFSGKKIRFPRMLRCEQSLNKLIEINEYMEGVPLKGFEKEFTAGVIRRCIDSLREFSALISPKEFDSLPRRSARFLGFIFPLYFFKALGRDLKKAGQYFKFFILFYRLVLFFPGGKKLIFSHRDLHKNNIIIGNKAAAIIDFEISALAEPETDLAIAARYFAKYLGSSLIKKLIRDLAPGNLSKRNFLRLTIFYAMQSLAIESKNHEFYADSQAYLAMLEKNIIPDILREKT